MAKQPLKLFHDAEFKMVDLDQKVRDEDANIIYIEGYASVFLKRNGERVIDRDGESVNVPFLDIESYKANPVLNYNHDFGNVIGKVVDIRKDERGLFVRAEVHKLTGRESIFEGVQKGLIRAFSIGFVPHEFSYLDNEDALEISKAEMVELSLLGTQSNPEALFTVTGQKSPTISKKVLAAQNGMTCDELTGSCMFKAELRDSKGKSIANSQKENKMSTATKEPTVDDKVEPSNAEGEAPKSETVSTETKPTPKPEVKETAETESKPKFDEQAIVAALLEAQNKAEEMKIAKAEDERIAKEQAELKAKEDAKARIEDAKAWIIEEKEKILATPDDEFDPDGINDFYELISGASEAIEDKVLKIITGQVAPATQPEA